MDKKTVFVKTDAGESEIGRRSDTLYGDVKRIFLLVDDESTVGEITKRAPPSLRDTLQDILQELVDGGYIRDMRAPVNVQQKTAIKITSPAFRVATPKTAAPPKPAPPSKDIPDAATQSRAPSHTPISPMPDMTMPTMPMPSPETKKEEANKSDKRADLDFSFIVSGDSRSSGGGEDDAAKEVKEKAQAEALLKARQEAERLRAEQAAQIEATARAAKLKAYEEAKVKAQIELAARVRIEAETRLKNEAEAAKLQAQQEALRARAESEAAKARVEAEVRARIEAEVRIKQEVEAARLKAEREAEKIRLELEAAKAKAEQERRIRLEAEARARAEAEARMKREAEAERLRLEKKRAELEMARVKAEAETRMRAEAEARLRAEVEARLREEALAQQKDRLAAYPVAPEEAGINSSIAGEALADPAERLRKSFVESFKQDSDKQKLGQSSFKLEKFSFVDTGKIAALTVQPKKPEALPGAGTKVKAALEQRAKKEAEARRIKAEQEAEKLRMEREAVARDNTKQQEAAAQIQAEQESIRLKAEHEAYRLKVEQDEKREKAEAEAKKLTDQQTKQWEEAQRRAATQAQAEKERLARELTEEKKAKAQQKTRRARRKPLPIGKIVASLFVLALIAVAGLPYVWPLDDYVAPLEKEISSQLNQPVHLKQIHFALLPLPKLELQNLTVGSREEFKVGNAVLNFDFSALFSPTMSINSIEFKNVTLAGASLDKLLAWLQAAGGLEKYPVAHMEFQNAGVTTEEDIKLPMLNGSADFDAQGKFIKANLKSGDAKYALDLQSLQNTLQLELNIRESSLPVLTAIKFNDLSVSGVVENGEVVFSDFFAHVYGGTLTGKGQLGWNNGWKLNGQINAKSLELKSMFPNFGVAGQLYGDVNVSMNGSKLALLARDPHMDGTFEAKDGVIKKLDIDTIARFGSRQGVAGHTEFSQLIGTLKSDSRGQHITLNKISAGAATGTGAFDVDEKQQLAGKLLVDIKGLANGNVPLRLSGSPAEPLLQAGR